MIVFVDTYAFIGWLNPQDAAHFKVSQYLAGFRGSLVTTEWILLELADALSAPHARTSVAAFLCAVRADSQFDLIGYDSSAYQAGFELFCARSDKAWSLTDCISFAAMEAKRLTDALTADHHFEQAGFRAVFA